MSEHVTLVGLISRDILCRARIIREYKSVTKVRYWMGYGWSDVQDAHPETLIKDGGRAAGWKAVNYNGGI